MNTVAHPAARPASTSLLRSPTIRLFLRLMPKFHGRLEDHAWLGLAAVAVRAMAVEAGLDGIEGQFTRHDLVHRVHFRVGDQSVSHVRLVGNYRQEKTRLLELLENGRGVGIQPEILQPP